MNVVNVTHARQNLYKLMRDVNSSHVPVHIAGKDGDCVLISAEDWKAIVETQYLNAIPGMAESIVKGSQSPIEDCVPLKDVKW